MKTYMFHYVLSDWTYYHFDYFEFEKVIRRLSSKYNVISIQEYNRKIESKENLDDCVLLTFDDGTIDHYKFVYPILKKYNCSGLFFLASSIFDETVLNVQLIHQLLALNRFDEIYDLFIIELNKLGYSIDKTGLRKNLDDEKTSIFKQYLQFKLPVDIRNKILDILIKKYNISQNEKEYYMNLENIKEMKRNGMYFGIHTVTHPNLQLLSYDEQYNEIKRNLDDLINNGIIDKDLLTIAYPYGIYDENTLKIAKDLGIKYGFKASRTKNISSLEIDRIDCNELKEV